MLFNKVILFVDVPFTKRDYKRFGINIFKNNNISVFIWDFGLLTNKNKYYSYDSDPGFKCDELIVFKTIKESKNSLKSLNSKDVVIIHIPFSIQTYYIFNLLHKLKVYYGPTSPGLVPIPPRVLNKKKIFKYLINPINTFKLLLQKVFINFFKTKNRFLIISGYISKPLKVNSSLDLIFSHQLDYDIFLNKKSSLKSKNNYAVFLDEYAPFHPDAAEEPVCEPENYYDDLNYFFDRIEDKLKLKIIIAAHPRSDYINSKYFNDRKILKSKTSSLIKNSSLVLTHASTANNFSVIFKKPILFITSSKYSNYFQSTINSFANEFNKTSIDISKNYEIDPSIYNIDSSAYEHYMNRFIKTKHSKDLNSWQIFINHLNNFFTTNE